MLYCFSLVFTHHHCLGWKILVYILSYCSYLSSLIPPQMNSDYALAICKLNASSYPKPCFLLKSYFVRLVSNQALYHYFKICLILKEFCWFKTFVLNANEIYFKTMFKLGSEAERLQTTYISFQSYQFYLIDLCLSLFQSFQLEKSLFY